MQLFLITIDRYNQLREYSCLLQQLEVAFKILNDIVREGHTLLGLRIVDDNHAISLPVEAFDGTCFAAMQELEQEWKAILSEPVRPAFATYQELRQMAQQRVEQSATRITNIEQTHNRFRAICQRARQLAARRPASVNLLEHYESLVNRYEVQLAKARFIHQLAVDCFGKVK